MHTFNFNNKLEEHVISSFAPINEKKTTMYIHIIINNDSSPVACTEAS